MGEPPQLDPVNRMYQVGKPLRMEVTTLAKPDKWIPAGLVYRIEVRVKVISRTTPTTVVETQKQAHWWFTSTPPPNEGCFTKTFTLTPQKPGDFFVEYELWVTDLFGRSTQTAMTLSGFTAR